MAKEFARRVSRKDRKKIDLSDRLDRDLFARLSDDGLLKGAKLDEMKLADIDVKEQVRTKFNDSSIKELAKNIQANGLIQPLVLHHSHGKYTLICGERRFRAMSSVKIKSAPCFVIENKSADELMAIQFSENSSREALHYIDKADGICNYYEATKASERKIVEALSISKSDVHRSLIIARLSSKIKEAAKEFDIEKYVLVEFSSIEDAKLKKLIEKQLINGEITKRTQLRKIIREKSLNATPARRAKKPATDISAEELIKKLSSNDKVDDNMLKLLKSMTKKKKKTTVRSKR